MSLNVRFTSNEVCSKTYNHIYVARTNEVLSPYICNVCEFSGTNYCMPTRWLTDPLQKIPPPWLKPLVTPLTVGGGTFGLVPGRHFPMSGPCNDLVNFKRFAGFKLQSVHNYSPKFQSLKSLRIKVMFFPKYAPNGLYDVGDKLAYVVQNCQLLKHILLWAHN